MMTSPTFSNFKLVSCQATLFTPDEEVSATRLMRDIFPNWSNRFDGEPTVFPAMEGLPKEVPRVIFQSKSNEWRCEIASARINLFWKKVSLDSSEPALHSFYKDASDLLLQYIKLNNPRIGRIAAVLNWVSPHESPGLFLANHFCSERWHKSPFNRLGNFELHAHKRFSLGGKFNVNSWVRNKTGYISFGEDRKSVVLVEQDLNTLAEESSSTNFSGIQFNEFFLLAAEEFTTILKLYYPEDNQ